MRMIQNVYAARLKDRERLLRSSSGGMFWALAYLFVNRGDAVACTVYNVLTKQAEFRLLTDVSQLDVAQGSKYMQSIPGNIFGICVRWLNEHKNQKLLFVGTGCQAAGFKEYIEKNKMRDRVLIVDLICHGVSSPKIWKEYSNLLEQQNYGKIESVSFKDKRNGWKTPYAYVNIQKKEIPISDYVDLFYSGCILRPVCHHCPYATVERETDLTIGDFWGIEKTLPSFSCKEGVSLVLIHTKLGNTIFDEIKYKLEVCKSTIKDCLQPNLISPTTKSEQREWFWRLYDTHGIIYAMNKLLRPKLYQRIKQYICNKGK